MFKTRCPICRSYQIEAEQCQRCTADLTDLLELEGQQLALYSAIFFHLREENYQTANDLIANARSVKADPLFDYLESFIQSIISAQNRTTPDDRLVNSTHQEH